MANPSSEKCSFHFFTWKLHFWLQDNLHYLHWWTNMVDSDLKLWLFRRWYKICHTYVHRAAIGGGTTCPYEQLTPTSPTLTSHRWPIRNHTTYRYNRPLFGRCRSQEILIYRFGIFGTKNKRIGDENVFKGLGLLVIFK